MHQVVGLLVLLGLNLALGPCASAIASDADYGCQHYASSHPLQHGEAANDHDRVSNDMPCATGAADCGTFGDINYDRRGEQLKLKDTPNDVPAGIIPAGESMLLRHSIELVGTFPTGSTLPGALTPLNVLHCVYLD
jgi:hypothetical protein